MTTPLRNPEVHTHNVVMINSEGYEMTLEARVDGDNIYFLRDINGVHAWHCNMVNINDYNVKKIIPIK